MAAHNVDTRVAFSFLCDKHRENEWNELSLLRLCVPDFNAD